MNLRRTVGYLGAILALMPLYTCHQNDTVRTAHASAIRKVAEYEELVDKQIILLDSCKRLIRETNESGELSHVARYAELRRQKKETPSLASLYEDELAVEGRYIAEHFDADVQKDLFEDGVASPATLETIRQHAAAKAKQMGQCRDLAMQALETAERYHKDADINADPEAKARLDVLYARIGAACK